MLFIENYNESDNSETKNNDSLLKPTFLCYFKAKCLLLQDLQNKGSV